MPKVAAGERRVLPTIEMKSSWRREKRVGGGGERKTFRRTTERSRCASRGQWGAKDQVHPLAGKAAARAPAQHGGTGACQPLSLRQPERPVSDTWGTSRLLDAGADDTSKR